MNLPPKLYRGVRFLDGPFNTNEWVRRIGPENVRLLDSIALPMIMEMQRSGLAVDVDFLVSYGDILTQEWEKIVEDIHDCTGYYVNPDSGDQVADLLFRKVKINVGRDPKKTKSGSREQVDDKALEEWSTLHPCIVMIQDARECTKLKSTYCDAIVESAVKIDDARIVFPRYKLTRVPSGRLACEDPNLMAIPVRSERGRMIRNAFIPRKAGHVLGTVDMSQIEMRAIAHDAKCVNMLKIFNTGIDFYWGTAELMYKMPIAAMIAAKGGDKNAAKDYYRFNAKTASLGIGYDITPEGLLDQFYKSRAFDWTLQAVTKLMADWYGSYPEVLSRRIEHHRRAKRYGYVWDSFGRIRYASGVRSLHPWVVSQVLRGVGNHPGQAMAQGGMKLTMAEVEDIRVEQFSTCIMPLLQVHDELVFEAESEQAWADFYPVIQMVMANCMPMLCPIDSSEAHSSDNWGDLEK